MYRRSSLSVAKGEHDSMTRNNEVYPHYSGDKGPINGQGRRSSRL